MPVNSSKQQYDVGVTKGLGKSLGRGVTPDSGPPGITSALGRGSGNNSVQRDPAPQEGKGFKQAIGRSGKK
jgi:hypothetical protein